MNNGNTKVLKEELGKKFKEAFGEGFRLLAVELQGFMHKVFFDDGKKKSPIRVEYYSAYDKKIDDQCTERAAKLLSGESHYSYQGNAIQIVYIEPESR